MPALCAEAFPPVLKQCPVMHVTEALRGPLPNSPGWTHTDETASDNDPCQEAPDLCQEMKIPLKQ